VRFSGGEPETYAIGLSGLEAAVKAVPNNPWFLMALGVAQYRTGQYQEALATLRRSDLLYRQKASDGAVHIMAVTAMSLHKLGRVDEARAAFEETQKIMKERGWRTYPEASAFLEEAKQLLEGSDTQTGPRETAKEAENQNRAP
jgi:tetratricopeptide (TPR) repeat protein